MSRPKKTSTRQLNEEAERDMMAQHDAQLDQLGDAVGRMKQVALEINADAEEQNKHLREMSGAFDFAENMLSGTMSRMLSMVDSNNEMGMCKLVGVMFIALVLVYYLVL